MRGGDEQQEEVFSYVPLEQRVPQGHPLRPIRKMVDVALRSLSEHFNTLYARGGRPSIAPEKLLRALVLQALYSKRSERLLMEELDYNLLFRWFVGLNADDPVWDVTVFTKNRERLMAGEVAHRFFLAVRQQLDAAHLLEDEHFSVDGTLLAAWASLDSYGEKPDPPQRGSGRDGQKLKRDTHASRTDPEARLFGRGERGSFKLSYLGHLLVENGHGLIVEACVTQSATIAEREAALLMLDRVPGRVGTLGADTQYQQQQFVEGLRQRNIVPHVAEYRRGDNLRKNSLRAEERGAEYERSLRQRKRIERCFAWIKQYGGLGRAKFRGRRKMEWIFQIAAASYNLLRLRQLTAVTG